VTSLPRAALLSLAFLGACQPQTAERTEILGELEHLETPAGPLSSEPNLAVAPDGVVYLSWLEARADSSRQLRFSALQGDVWSGARPIASGRDWFLSPVDLPSLGILPGGRMVAHYLQRDGNVAGSGGYGVRIVQSHDGGASWGRPLTPYRDSVVAEHGFASLFRAPSDSVGIVWLDGRVVGATALRYAALAADGTPGPETMLDERVCDCCSTAVATTELGPVVAYRGRTADGVRDILLARRVGGRWLPGTPVHRDGWKIDACPVNGPAVAAMGERVAVAWFTAARDTPRVLIAFSDDAGASFGPATRVDGGNPAGRTGVVLLDGGGALVSWVEHTDSSIAEVQARLVSPSGRLGNPVLIAQPGGGRAAGLPRMVRSGSEIIFAWTRAGRKPIVQSARIHLGETK
jgi:hypothetical protein